MPLAHLSQKNIWHHYYLFLTIRTQRIHMLLKQGYKFSLLPGPLLVPATALTKCTVMYDVLNFWKRIIK